MRIVQIGTLLFSKMENHLLLCILLLIPAFASSDFLVTHVRNIKVSNQSCMGLPFFID